MNSLRFGRSFAALIEIKIDLVERRGNVKEERKMLCEEEKVEKVETWGRRRRLKKKPPEAQSRDAHPQLRNSMRFHHLQAFQTLL